MAGYGCVDMTIYMRPLSDRLCIDLSDLSRDSRKVPKREPPDFPAIPAPPIRGRERNGRKYRSPCIDLSDRSPCIDISIYRIMPLVFNMAGKHRHWFGIDTESNTTLNNYGDAPFVRDIHFGWD